jgi:hypothetical protein
MIMETEKQAAEVLLDRGVGWKLSAPWYLRILGKKTVTVTIKPLRLGTLLELSRLYAGMNIDASQLEKDPTLLVNKHATTVCRIAAVCMLNKKGRIWMFSGFLTKFLLSRLTANALLEVMIFISTYSGVEAFIDTIRLIGEMRMTAPRNLSPEDQGSQKTE